MYATNIRDRAVTVLPEEQGRKLLYSPDESAENPAVLLYERQKSMRTGLDLVLGSREQDMVHVVLQVCGRGIHAEEITEFEMQLRLPFIG